MRDIVSAANSAATSSSSAVISHHRSSSDDDQRHQLMIDRWAWPGRVSGSDVTRPCRASQRSSAAVCRRDTLPPIHLISATNQVRSGQVQPQQLPLKLASSSDRRPRWSPGSPQTVDQHSGRNTPEPQVCFSSPVDDESSADQRDSNDRRSGTTPGASWVVPHTGTSMLPMKLAERPRPKSASSGPTVHPASSSTSPAGGNSKTTTTSSSSSSSVRHGTTHSHCTVNNHTSQSLQHHRRIIYF